MTQDKVIQLLKRRIKEFGTQEDYADFVSVSRVTVNAVLNKRSRPTKAILDDLGLVEIKKYSYEKL